MKIYVTVTTKILKRRKSHALEMTPVIWSWIKAAKLKDHFSFVDLEMCANHTLDLAYTIKLLEHVINLPWYEISVICIVQ